MTTPPSSNTKIILGDLGELSLFDLVQFLSSNRKTGLLTLRQEGQRGFVYLEDGAIVNAIGDDLAQGLDILKSFFRWTDGTFEFDTAQRTNDYTISVATDSLLFDIARELDEGADAPEPPGRTSLDAVREQFTSAVHGAPTGAVPADAAHRLEEMLTLLAQLPDPALLIGPGRPPFARTDTGLKPINREPISRQEIDQLLQAAGAPGRLDHETLGSFWVRRFTDSFGDGLELVRLLDEPPDPLAFNPWPGSLEKIIDHRGPALLLGNRAAHLSGLALAAAVALAARGMHLTAYQTTPSHTLDGISGFVRLLPPRLRAGRPDLIATLDATDPTDAVVFVDLIGTDQMEALSRYNSGGLPVIAPALFSEYANRPVPLDPSENDAAPEALLAISVHTDDARST